MIRALVFDFDGLILETEEPIYQSWQELYQEYGCQLSFDDWALSIGTSEFVLDPFTELQKLVGQRLDPEALLPKRLQWELDMIYARPIQPGVEDLLAQAHQQGIKIALASSSSSKWVTGHLSRLGILPYFEQIKTSDDVAITKPAPDLYLAVVEALGVLPDEALALEDSPNGILSAKRAGLYCVAVPNALTSRLTLDLADLRLETLAGLSLSELLARFNIAYS